MEQGIFKEAYDGMQATTLAIREGMELKHAGKYRVDGDGVLWKGNLLDILETTSGVDQIKQTTGMEVTIF